MDGNININVSGRGGIMRKRLNINRQTPAAVYLKITSYVGSATVYWAKHWQGTLTSSEDREGFPVTYTMTQDEADESNKGDGPYDFGGAMGAYSEGDESTRFLSADRLRDAALACWQTHYPKAKVLIEGEVNCYMPQPIWAGPPEIEARVNAIWVECEGLDWWESGNDAEVDKLVDEWMHIWKYEIEPLA